MTEPEDEAEDVSDPISVSIIDGDIHIPDMEFMDGALDEFGVVVLAWRNRGGELEALLASKHGFKWACIESISNRPALKTVQ